MKPAILFLLFLMGAVLAAAAGAVQAQELGRLFFTPEQRDALDARRKARVPDKPAAVAVQSPTMRLDGYVKRSGGKSTVWVDGQPADDGTRVPSGSSDSSLTVSVGDGGARVRMKPGETLNRDSGKVHDVIGDGKIQVRRRSP
jgi:hypothetical protein